MTPFAGQVGFVTHGARANQGAFIEVLYASSQSLTAPCSGAVPVEGASGAGSWHEPASALAGAQQTRLVLWMGGRHVNVQSRVLELC